MQKITPFLWFNNQAEEAVKFNPEGTGLLRRNKSNGRVTNASWLSPINQQSIPK